MSSPPLQEYFTKLLKEKHVTIASCRIVNDNAHLPKSSNERFSEIQSGLSSMMCKTYCRWSPSPAIVVHRGSDGNANSSNQSTTVCDITRLRSLLKSNEKSDLKSKQQGLSRSVSACLMMVPKQYQPVEEQPSLRRCASLDTPLMLPTRKRYSTRGHGKASTDTACCGNIRFAG